MSDAPPPVDPTPETPGIPAGMYQNPETGESHWWDGSKWGAPPAPEPAAAPETPTTVSDTPTVAPVPVPVPSRFAPLSVVTLVVAGLAFLIGFIPILGILAGLASIALGVLVLVKRAKPAWAGVVAIGAGTLAALTSLIVVASLWAGVSSPSAVPEADTSSSPSATRTQTPKPVVMVVVPNVVGMTVQDATAALEAVGLIVAGGDPQDDLVTATRPAAGETIEEGTVVVLDHAVNLGAFAETDERTFAQIAKDPDSYIGTKLIIYGSVTQFDSATGPCTMRVNTGHAITENSFEYQANTLVSSGTSTDCPVLGPIVQDDHLKIWGTVLGAYSYDTAIGGTATAILFDAVQVELLAAQEF